MTKRPFWTLKRMIGALVLVNAIVVPLAWKSLQRLNQMLARPLNQLSAEKERDSIGSLASIAAQGTWDDFDKARTEQATQLISQRAKASSPAAVYFYPETLPPQSLERQFVADDLAPGVATLRHAYALGQIVEARHALRVLESRVGNYELGASGTADQLSPEAQQFLGIYRQFMTRMPNPRAPTSDKPSK